MVAEKKAFAILQGGFLGALGLLLWRSGAFPPLIFATLVVSSLIVVFWPRPTVWVDLAPYLILLLTYQSLRTFADSLSPEQIHISDLIDWEQGLTGGMPAATLRQAVASFGLAPLADLVANLAYFSHFVIPVGLSLWLHRRHERAYWPVVTAFLGLCYAGFLTYILFPAAPPWWATQEGYLGGARAVNLEGFLLSAAEMERTPNPFAAMPSMHCAFPLFWALMMTWLGSRMGRFLWGVTALVAVSVIYLGHHYVVDVVAGWAYGAGAFLIARLALGRPIAGGRQASALPSPRVRAD